MKRKCECAEDGAPIRPRNGFTHDRNGDRDPVMFVMMLVGVFGAIAILWSIGVGSFTIYRLGAIEAKEPIAYANGVAAILSATGTFIGFVLGAVSLFGAAVMGYVWTDGKNRIANAQAKQIEAATPPSASAPA